MSYIRIATLRTADLFREHLAAIGASLDFDEVVKHGATSPLTQSLDSGLKIVSNRFAILPMEGWDVQADGSPYELKVWRWKRFGKSGVLLMLKNPRALHTSSRGCRPGSCQRSRTYVSNDLVNRYTDMRNGTD